MVLGVEGSCSHSLRQTHSSVRLIGPEWRHKWPPMDTLRLVIKLQAFVLLSVAFWRYVRNNVEVELGSDTG